MEAADRRWTKVDQVVKRGDASVSDVLVIVGEAYETSHSSDAAGNETFESSTSESSDPVLMPYSTEHFVDPDAHRRRGFGVENILQESETPVDPMKLKQETRLRNRDCISKACNFM